MKIAIYHEYIPRLGGIETAVFELTKLFVSENHEVDIYFKGAESGSVILKYSQVATQVLNVARLTKKVKYDFLLIASNHQKPHSLEGERVYQWVHSDYEKYNLKLKGNKVDGYIAVSQHASNIFKKLYGHDCIVIQNILDSDFNTFDSDSVLKLVANTRISPEKGMERMLTLCNDLKTLDIDFTLDVYGDNSHNRVYEKKIIESFSEFDSVTFHGYKKDIRLGLLRADYLVQLSDFEGCPYSVLEALSFGIPCILTDFPSAHELIKEGENGYILPLNMRVPESKYIQIATKIPINFTFDQKKQKKKWIDLVEG